MVAFIEFFDKTENKKGFVFAKDIRTKLIKSVKNVNWTQEE